MASRRLQSLPKVGDSGRVLSLLLNHQFAPSPSRISHFPFHSRESLVAPLATPHPLLSSLLFSSQHPSPLLPPISPFSLVEKKFSSLSRAQHFLSIPLLSPVLSKQRKGTDVQRISSTEIFSSLLSRSAIFPSFSSFSCDSTLLSSSLDSSRSLAPVPHSPVLPFPSLLSACSTPHPIPLSPSVSKSTTRYSEIAERSSRTFSTVPQFRAASVIEVALSRSTTLYCLLRGAENHLRFNSAQNRSYSQRRNAGEKSSAITRQDEEDVFDSLTDKIPQRPVTAAEGASYSLVILFALALAGIAVYAVVKELLIQPKEYKVFDKTLDRIRDDSQVISRLGSPITGYGQEGRNRASRQRIANKVFQDEDGIEHIQVQFHIRGPGGTGLVHSEMFRDREDGNRLKFTYLIVDILRPTPKRLLLESYVPK